jgi:CAAX prenyl protease-like protein
MLFTALAGLLDSAHILPGGVAAKYLLFPFQTVVCAGVLAWFWREYRLRLPRKAWLAALVAVLVFANWVSPQALFHQAPRLQGFDPGLFAGRPALYWAELALRFLRLVAVVPALEEIFWRGLLLRYLINEEFDAVPFGTYTRLSNAVVAIGFMLEHSTPDWPAALATGVLYNFVAYRTRSLSSCILAHAITNALLGVYIMMTRQWGFW